MYLIGNSSPSAALRFLPQGFPERRRLTFGWDLDSQRFYRLAAALVLGSQITFWEKIRGIRSSQEGRFPCEQMK